MAKIREEWYIIVNPHAGSGKTMYKWMPAETKLEELGVPFYTVFTTHKHHASELAAVAARQGYRKIMAVGGDGSIHEVFSGIISWCEQTGTDPGEFYLAVSPIGSGNDWIKIMNVPNDGLEVAKLISQNSFKRQDIVQLSCAQNKYYMINIGGVGFDSHVAHRVNCQKEHGKRHKLIYAFALLHTILHLKPISVRVEIDGSTVFEGSALSIAFGTGRYSGGGMMQTSKALVDDGLLDLMLVPRISLGRIALEVGRIFKGTTHKSEYIKYYQGKQATITPLDERSADFLEIDGEIEGKLPLKLSVLERQINVLCGK